MKTVLLPAGRLRSSGTVPLSAAESRHLRARRANDGETVHVTDGQGAVAAGTLRVADRTVVVELDAVRHVPPPAPLVLAVGAGDRTRFRWFVEKASELSVTEIIPLETTRSRAVATRVRARHVARLEAQAREAVKQSGGAWAPRVRAPRPIVEFLACLPQGGFHWLADRCGVSPAQLAVDAGSPVVVAVGPEGGFTEEERADLLAADFRPIFLGVQTLRFETAAIAAAALAGIQRKRGHHG